MAFRWANPFLVTEVGEIPAEPYAGEIAALDDVRPADKVAAEHGLRDALRRGDTLRSAYDRFGVL